MKSLFAMKKIKLLLLIAIGLMLFPEAAFAAKSIKEFSTPFETITGTITGPVGRYVSIAAMAITGITYIMKKETLDGGMKMLLSVVFGISMIAFASPIVLSMFNFDGAVL